MTFKFSGVLLRFTGFQREMQIPAATIDAAIHSLLEQQPQLRNVLLDNSGKIRVTHRLFLNGEQLSHDDLARSVAERDCVEILTAIAGG